MSQSGGVSSGSTGGSGSSLAGSLGADSSSDDALKMPFLTGPLIYLFVCVNNSVSSNRLTFPNQELKRQILSF